MKFDTYIHVPLWDELKPWGAPSRGQNVEVVNAVNCRVLVWFDVSSGHVPPPQRSLADVVIDGKYCPENLQTDRGMELTTQQSGGIFFQTLSITWRIHSGREAPWQLPA